MTKQETYNIVRDHLIRQGRKALGAAGLCRYRAPNGDKCAAGALIPDADYQPEMEGRGVKGNSPGSALVRDVLARDGHDLDLVSSLQEVHDYWKPEADISVYLAEFARKYGLAP